MMYEFYWLGYYQAINNRSSERSTFIYRDLINLGANQYLQENSSIDIKKQLKNKEEINYNSLDVIQLKAFYHWSKYEYPKKYVFNGFIPHDSDIELIREGKLTDDFYNFSYTVPVIFTR